MPNDLFKEQTNASGGMTKWKIVVFVLFVLAFLLFWYGEQSQAPGEVEPEHSLLMSEPRYMLSVPVGKDQVIRFSFSEPSDVEPLEIVLIEREGKVRPLQLDEDLRQLFLKEKAKAFERKDPVPSNFQASDSRQSI